MRSGKELREQIHDPCEVDNLAQLKKKKLQLVMWELRSFMDFLFPNSSYSEA